jgi:hypothetical protein
MQQLKIKFLPIFGIKVLEFLLLYKIFGISLGITFLWIGITLIIGRIGRGPIDYTYFKGNTFEIFVVPLLSALIFSVLCRYLLAKERYSYH